MLASLSDPNQWQIGLWIKSLRRIIFPRLIARSPHPSLLNRIQIIWELTIIDIRATGNNPVTYKWRWNHHLLPFKLSFNIHWLREVHHHHHHHFDSELIPWLPADLSFQTLPLVLLVWICQFVCEFFIVREMELTTHWIIFEIKALMRQDL